MSITDDVRPDSRPQSPPSGGGGGGFDKAPP
ncbi:MAG: hypothetical protein QOC94_4266, partial [Actinoplanes sp.]|nr:hypothetical protein [Actinoplanes sp.]